MKKRNDGLRAEYEMLDLADAVSRSRRLSKKAVAKRRARRG